MTPSQRQYLRDLRARRKADRKQTSITSSTMIKMLAEMYEIGSLSQSLQAEYRLIGRYWDKLGKKHHIRSLYLEKEGKKAFPEAFKSLVYKKNPFLSMIEKSEPWQGTVMPIQFGETVSFQQPDDEQDPVSPDHQP